MAQIKAQIITDSKNEFGNRITTFVLTYPRIIHSELMTHRVFSRNAASSRAVPASKLIEAIENDPFVPIAWQRSHSGMQGTIYITSQEEIDLEIQDWLDDRDYAVKKAKARLARGVTKQLVNRPLEPFQWYTCILTATEYENFFSLRCPQYEIAGTLFRSKKDAIKQYRDWEDGDELDWLLQNKGQAEIHMMALAEAMWDAYNESVPKELKAGEWHIPFGNSLELIESMRNVDRDGERWSDELVDSTKLKIATARCARVSYTVVGEEGKEVNYKKDIELHDRLISSKHMSPMEHCAKALDSTERSRNFLGGWKQYREIVEDNLPFEH